VFGLSLAGLAVSTLHTFGLSEGAEVMGTTGAIFTAVIWIIAILLFFYARAQAKKGVLR
jgi:amino acid transporter